MCRPCSCWDSHQGALPLGSHHIPSSTSGLHSVANKIRSDPYVLTDVPGVWFFGEWPDKHWNPAPADNWFQNVTVVGNGSRIYRHVSSFLRVDIGGGAAKNDARNALANSASVDDMTRLPCRYGDHVQRQTSRTDRPRSRGSLSPHSPQTGSHHAREGGLLLDCNQRDGDGREQGNDPRRGRRGSSSRSVPC